MRLWSLHPSYLDAKGLVALWREALLAQAVLSGKTKGYLNHPQLIRFKECRDPLASLSTYLWAVAAEADKRNYCFDVTKIQSPLGRHKIRLTQGQLEFEMQHLLRKLERRDMPHFDLFQRVKDIKPHPIFTVLPGEIAVWERP